MRLFRFLGDGEEEIDTEILHIEDCLGADYTLCGVTLDDDTHTAGTVEVVISKKITCHECRSIIEYCKNITL